MRSRLFILLLIICGLAMEASAQRVKRKGITPIQINKKDTVARYSLKQLDGKWQEIKRMPVRGNEPVNFSDTLLMNFHNDKVELKDATSMSITMKGVAQIDPPNSLTAAGDIYTIQSLGTNKLVINDGEFIRELKKTNGFYYETVGKLILEKDSFSNPVHIDINNIKGKWDVYSRKAEPGFVTDQTAVIKTLNILDFSDDGTATGEVIFYIKTVTEKVACKISIKETTIQIISEKHTWTCSTYKADGKEFIFGNAGKLLYFSKH